MPRQLRQWSQQKICRPQNNFGRHLGRHCRLPTWNSRAVFPYNIFFSFHCRLPTWNSRAAFPYNIFFSFLASPICHVQYLGSLFNCNVTPFYSDIFFCLLTFCGAFFCIYNETIKAPLHFWTLRNSRMIFWERIILDLW